MQVVEQQLAQPKMWLFLPHLFEQAENLGNTRWVTWDHDVAGLTPPSSATEAGEEGLNHGTSPTASLCSLERVVRCRAFTK